MQRKVWTMITWVLKFFPKFGIVLAIMQKGRHWVLVVRLHCTFLPSFNRATNLVHFQVLLLGNVVCNAHDCTETWSSLGVL